MTGMGQEDQFPPPRLSACYVIREKTFAGTHANGRDAPIAAVRGTGWNQELRPNPVISEARPGSSFGRRCLMAAGPHDCMVGAMDRTVAASRTLLGSPLSRR